MSKQSTLNRVSNTVEHKLLIVDISNVKYGFDLLNVKEIIRMPELTLIPNTSTFVKGLIRLRDKVLPLIDVRKKLGLKSTDDEDKEFVEMLNAREQDHLNWINELRRCVVEKADFKLTTDPHACKFGKWYDNYKTNNLIITAFLEKFDKPHKKVHSIARECIDLQHKNQADAALKIIHETEQREMKELVGLFAELKNLTGKSRREFAIIFEIDGLYTSVAADRIERIISVNPDKIDKEFSFNLGDFFNGIYKHDDGIYTILNPKALTFDEAQKVNQIVA